MHGQPAQSFDALRSLRFSVGHQLLLGFAPIAALGLAVAATGCQAIHALPVRQQLMAEMIRESITAVRDIAERSTDATERMHRAHLHRAELGKRLQGLL